MKQFQKIQKQMKIKHNFDCHRLNKINYVFKHLEKFRGFKACFVNKRNINEYEKTDAEHQ